MKPPITSGVHGVFKLCLTHPDMVRYPFQSWFHSHPSAQVMDRMGNRCNATPESLSEGSAKPSLSVEPPINSDLKQIVTGQLVAVNFPFPAVNLQLRSLAVGRDDSCSNLAGEGENMGLSGTQVHWSIINIPILSDHLWVYLIFGHTHKIISGWWYITSIYHNVPNLSGSLMQFESVHHFRTHPYNSGWLYLYI